MNIKKLNIPDYIKRTINREKTLEVFVPFNPPILIGREGLYLYHNQCWIELDDGRCFLHDKERFKQELLYIEVEFFKEEQRQSIKLFVKNAPNKFITDELRQYADTIYSFETHSNIQKRLSNYKSRKAFKIKFNKYKELNELKK